MRPRPAGAGRGPDQRLRAGAGWLVYDLLCRSPLGDDTPARARGFVFLVARAYGFTLIFSGRGAYMQIGTLIGTIMVANVLL